jgi:tetratricopeptide (TPR) repeat protein
MTTQAPFPRISIVIPNYNHGACLGVALESACTQDPPPHEVYVFDDCSTDNSVQVVETFVARFPFVRLLRYPCKSADWLRALGANLPVLSGDYVLGLGADDYLYPGLIGTLGTMIRERPDCGAFFADWHYVDGNRKVIGEMRSGLRAPCFLEDAGLLRQLCRLNVFESGVGSIVRKDLLLWLSRAGAATMGPLLDSIGYPILAMRHGACYVPEFLAACSGVSAPGRVKYGHDVMRDVRKALGLVQSVKRFLESPEVGTVAPAELREVLEIKSLLCIDFPRRNVIALRRILERGQVLIRERRLEEADAWLRRAVKIFPREAEAHFAFGVVQHKLGRLGDEETAFRRALELNPGIAAAHSNWGICRQMKGFTEDAIAAYRRAIRADPGFAPAYDNLASLLFAKGRFRESLEARQKAVALAPRIPGGYVQLGATLVALGRLDEAAAACRNALALDPNLGEARALLDSLERKSGLPNAAS